MDNKIEKEVRKLLHAFKQDAGWRLFDFDTGREFTKETSFTGQRFLMRDSENCILAGQVDGLSEADLKRWVMGAGANLYQKKLSAQMVELLDKSTPNDGRAA